MLKSVKIGLYLQKGFGNILTVDQYKTVISITVKAVFPAPLFNGHVVMERPPKNAHHAQLQREKPQSLH